MDIRKSDVLNDTEKSLHILESKKITSFQAVKEFFKNVFLDFIDKVDSSKASYTEKNHEIYFYSGDLTMAILEQEDEITIWRLDSKVSRVLAILDFESGFSIVKYVNPVKIAYLCEDEIEKILKFAFQLAPVLH